MFSEMASFLMLIKDSDRVISFNCYITLFNTAEYGCSICGTHKKFCISKHVRRAAVLALNTAAHNKPNLIKALLPELLPLLYDQTEIKVIFQSAHYFVCRLFLTGGVVTINCHPQMLRSYLSRM
jgi:hypothetical protein